MDQTFAKPPVEAAGPALGPRQYGSMNWLGLWTLCLRETRRFWKVVCAVKNERLQVFAFLLEQDLKGVPVEFQVDAKWKRSQVKLKALEKIIGLLTFPQVYHDADQG